MTDSFSRKTFGEDTYGRHSLNEPGGPGDVCHLDYLPGVNLTRMPLNYRPRHAAPSPCQDTRGLALAYLRVLTRAVGDS